MFALFRKFNLDLLNSYLNRFQVVYLRWRAVCRLAKRRKKCRQKYCRHIAHLTAKTSNVDGQYVDKYIFDRARSKRC